MGQSKWRKANDPTFGRRKRGLLLTSPTKIGSDRFEVAGGIDPQELRFGLFFWDRIAHPQSEWIHIGSSEDELFLQREGILSRPTHTFRPLSHEGMMGSVAQSLMMTHLAAYDELQKQRGITWAFAQGERSFDCPQLNSLQSHDEIALELIRTVPVPKEDVPLAEILEFKLRRGVELEAFREHIDGFVEVTIANQSFDDALGKYSWEIDQACANLLRVSREWHWPVYLADKKVGFSFNPFKVAAAGKATWDLAEPYGLKAAAAAAGLGALASCFTVTGQPKIRTNPLSKSPYRYAHHLHHELR